MAQRQMSKQRTFGPPKPRTGYWYEVWYSECVLCGRHHEYRERRYTPKSENPYHFEQFACGDHFL
jgi:hypothetical protein